MTDLRKAAEMALNHLTNLQPYLGNGLLNKTQLAFVEPNIDEAMKELRQALAQNDLEEAIAKETKAWADVPDATEWVEQLRGNVDKVYISEERVQKSDKSIHEPVAFVNGYFGGYLTITCFDSTLVLPDGLALYTAPPKKEWVGLTEDEVAQAMYRADAIVTGPMQFKFAEEIEAKLKEKNT